MSIARLLRSEDPQDKAKIDNHLNALRTVSIASLFPDKNSLIKSLAMVLKVKLPEKDGKYKVLTGSRYVGCGKFQRVQESYERLCLASAVDESLSGLVSVHTGLQLVSGCRAVVRADLDEERARGNVLILTGGGSGHEPAFAGFVGAGLLTCAVPGAIFASPPPSQIQAALQTIGHGHTAGVLVIVLNYTGDRLNFGVAVEACREQGMLVKTVTVGEDCALTSHDRTAGRRGLTGAILAIKIAGAMASEGRSLDEIHSVLTETCTEMGSIGLSLSACSVPGQPPNFSLGADQMELGLGVHGEAGVRRMSVLPAKQAVSSMLDHMTDPASSTCLPVNKGDHIALLVNNLGGLSQLEMGIVAGEAITYFESRGSLVDRVYCGTYITSMEMAGVIISVLHLDDARKRYLDAATSAPAWVRPMLAPGQTDRRRLSPRPVHRPVQHEHGHGQAGQGDAETGVLLYRCVSSACGALLASEDLLNRLDHEAGDGDCGTTLARGAQEILSALGEECAPGLDTRRPHRLLSQLADITSRTMGGTSGALYSLLLSAAAGELRAGSDGAGWRRAYKAGMDAVMRYGGARLGDRTMLDAMIPGQEALNQTSGLEASAALQRIAQACESGAAQTAGMAAHAGRASYVHSDNLGQADPGATAFAILTRAVHSACV